MEDLLDAEFDWLEKQIKKADPERTRLTHPCVVGLTAMGYGAAYLDGLIVGLMAYHHSAVSSYLAKSRRRDNQGSGIRGRHDRW